MEGFLFSFVEGRDFLYIPRYNTAQLTLFQQSGFGKMPDRDCTDKVGSVTLPNRLCSNKAGSARCQIGFVPTKWVR